MNVSAGRHEGRVWVAGLAVYVDAVLETANPAPRMHAGLLLIRPVHKVSGFGVASDKHNVVQVLSVGLMFVAAVSWLMLPL
jgi:hypothetical protein